MWKDTKARVKKENASLDYQDTQRKPPKPKAGQNYGKILHVIAGK